MEQFSSVALRVTQLVRKITTFIKRIKKRLLLDLFLSQMNPFHILIFL